MANSIISRLTLTLAALVVWVVAASVPSPAMAQVTAFKMAVAESASKDEEVAAFYRETGFEPLWTGPGEVDRERRAQLMHAIRSVADHGLPAARYDADALMRMLADVRSPRDRGKAEIAMTQAFLKYARDIQTGMLVPNRIDSTMVREVDYRDRKSYLTGLKAAKPAAYFRSLPPRSMEYNALIKEKVAMEKLMRSGGWGPQVPAASLEPGDQGAAVIALRNRLIAMKYLPRTNVPVYDADVEAAVREFQRDHGLNEDGVAGSATMQQINVSVEKRLQSVLVAMERERWFNTDRGKRHVLVNIPDFTAKIIDDGKITFETRSVVGARHDNRATPEFSDVMEHMVVNPSWYVPRSIATNEYLPALKRNPYAVRHIEITDSRGRPVNRGAVNFAAYTARTFPFAMRQPPSRSNALGLVKFMFPNKHNIYLHDTPAKSLFARDVRAFSHGCVRLAQPFDFAYELLSRQEKDPKAYFHSVLNTGRETKVVLAEPIPVHLIYRTAVTNARGHTEYRADVYGRDARIWDALSRAGVVLGGVQG